MRVPIVILALIATPLIADVSSAQAKAVAKGKKDECSKPGLRTGQKSSDWIAKHLDKSCQPAPTPPPAPSQSTGTAITGIVYLDLDWSDMPNDGEPRLSGWTVQLVSNGAVTKSVTTGASGAFTFADVVAGNYTVCVVPMPGFGQIGPMYGIACPSGIGYAATVTMYDLNVVFEGLNFGFYDTTAQ